MPIKGKQLADNSIEKIKLSPTLQTEINNKVNNTLTVNNKPLTGNIVLDKVDIGLPNVDNTPDINKPVSGPQQIQFDRKISKGLIADFRDWFDSNQDAFYLTEVQKSGLFAKNLSDTTSSDDSGAMTLIKDAKRFKRIDNNGTIHVEFFGAVADGVRIPDTNNYTGTDNTLAIQNALNYANDLGLDLCFDKGIYLISNTLKPKRVESRKSYKLNFYGRGKGITILRGIGNTLTGKNLIEFDFQAGDSTAWNDSHIRIHDLSIQGGTADRGLYANKTINIEIDHCIFIGGEKECLKLGDTTGDNFAAYIHHNYFNTGTLNGGQNECIMHIRSSYAEVYNNVSDGGYYALRCTLNQMYIAGNTFEGYKYAGIFAEESGGGNSKIVGNTLRPYQGFDPNNMFQGESHGIYIRSVGGGLFGNTITGNQIFSTNSNLTDDVAIVSNKTGTLTPSPLTSYKVVGQTSGATARLNGFNLILGTAQLGKLTGTFVAGETLVQDTTGGSFKIDSLKTKLSTCLNLGGPSPNGVNTVVGNKFSGGDYGAYLTSPNNLIANNMIVDNLNGIYSTRDNFTLGNVIVVTNYAIHRSADNLTNVHNVIRGGTLNGIAPDMDSKLNTSAIDAIPNGDRYEGLRLYDTTIKRYKVWNGTSWEASTSERFITGTTAVADINAITTNGFKTYSNTSNNRPAGHNFGNILTLHGNNNDGTSTTAAGTFSDQLLFSTEGLLTYMHRTYTYGPWTAYDVHTTREFTKIATVATPVAVNAVVAVGSAPTKEEYDTLRQDVINLRATLADLIAKAKVSKILNS